MVYGVLFAVAFFAVAFSSRADGVDLTNEVQCLFLQPSDNRPVGYSDNDEIREQKRCADEFAKQYGLTEAQVVRLMCAAFEKLLDKPEDSVHAQGDLGRGMGALMRMGDRSATNVLEKAIFSPTLKKYDTATLYAIFCYFALAKEDGIDTAYRMLAKPDVFQRLERFTIYSDGMLPLIEKKDVKTCAKVATFLREAAKKEDVEDNATYIDRYLLKADPTWTNDVARKVFADRFVKRPAIMPYFREVQQKIGKPEADAAK